MAQQMWAQGRLWLDAVSVEYRTGENADLQPGNQTIDTCTHGHRQFQGLLPAPPGRHRLQKVAVGCSEVAFRLILAFETALLAYGQASMPYTRHQPFDAYNPPEQRPSDYSIGRLSY